MDLRMPADREPWEREVDGMVPGREEDFLTKRVKASDYGADFEFDLGDGETITAGEIEEMSNRLADAAEKGEEQSAGRP
jgi:hypothetical protein